MFALDMWVLKGVADHRTASATDLSSALMSASGNVLVLGTLAVLVGGYLVVRRRWSTAIAVLSAAVIAVVLTGILKVLIGRPRPPAALALVHAAGFSMPSTDGALTAASATALFLTVTWSTRKARHLFASGLVVLVLVIGLCLVYLGAHWPTDVIAGWAVGVLVGWGIHRAQRRVGATEPRS